MDFSFIRLLKCKEKKGKFIYLLKNCYNISDVKQYTTCNNIRYVIYKELFKSLKHVECDIECFATTAFIMVHHYLAYTIVKMDIPAFVAFIYMYREAAILFLRFVRSR